MQFTAATGTDFAQLAEELEVIREHRWSSAVGEWEEGNNALAAPVRVSTDELVAAVSVTAPDFRAPASEFEQCLGSRGAAAKNFASRLGFSRIDPTTPSV